MASGERTKVVARVAAKVAAGATETGSGSKRGTGTNPG